MSPVTVAATESAAEAHAAGNSGPTPAIEINHVSKTFRLPKQRYSTLKERVLHPLASSEHDELKAVQDVDVQIAPGEFFGIVGRNGSGKSTLLKCLAGIYDPDVGDVTIRGRLSPFIELGVGFNPDLTARDNVIINAIMLGLTRKEARRRFDEIIEFAELHDFLDMKLKNYSSGMRVRLAFSVAVQVDADILLIDEVLAVGDAAFQQKCFEQFQKMHEEGRTILFVTHDMSAVERFCDRALLLEHGKVVDLGDPADIARQYNELNFGRPELVADEDALTGSSGARAGVAVRRAWFENLYGQQVITLESGERCRACLEIHFERDVENPIFQAVFRNDTGAVIVSLDTGWRHGLTGMFHAGETVQVVFQFDSHLAPSRYALSAIVSEHDRAEIVSVHEVASLMIHSTVLSGGVVDPPHEIEITRT